MRGRRRSRAEQYNLPHTSHCGPAEGVRSPPVGNRCYSWIELDICLRAAVRRAGLEIAVATSTRLCREAQNAHGLQTTSAIALGRLLTASLLVALTSKRRGVTSFQIVTRSNLRQIYADATHEGHVRGFAKNPSIDFPLFEGERYDGRRSIAQLRWTGLPDC